jgi:hypothetical protein
MRVSGELHASAALLTRKQPPVLIEQEAGWVPEPVWTLRRRCPCRELDPGRSARSPSLYRLSYRGVLFSVCSNANEEQVCDGKVQRELFEDVAWKLSE